MDELKIGTEHYRWVPTHTHSSSVLRYYVTSGKFAIVVNGVVQVSFTRGYLEDLMDALEDPSA